MYRLFSSFLIVLGFLVLGKLPEPKIAAGAPAPERPLIVQQNEGEVRVWRNAPSDTPAVQKLSYFVIKVDGQNGGSPDFWFGTENMPVGGEIPYHRHLHEDEVLYIGSGTAHVHVGSLEGDARAGALVFVPRDTWVSLRNVGKTPISLLFGFNAPGFDRYMRCESVPRGQAAPPLSVPEDQHCSTLGDVQYR